MFSDLQVILLLRNPCISVIHIIYGPLLEKTLFFFWFLAAKLCSKTIGLLLSPSFPRVARRNRKRQPRKRRVHTGRRRGKKTVQEDNIRSDRLVPVGSAAGGCGTLSRDRTCHFVSRFCRSSTWHINEHVLLLVIKLKLAHLPEGTDVVSVRAVRVMAVEIHVSVAAAISLMWHICGSWWRWSVSSAPRIYFFCCLVPPSATSEIKFGEGLKTVLLLLLLYFTPLLRKLN